MSLPRQSHHCDPNTRPLSACSCIAAWVPCLLLFKHLFYLLLCLKHSVNPSHECVIRTSAVALDLLCVAVMQCRGTLKWSYVAAFYQRDGAEKRMFEFRQKVRWPCPCVQVHAASTVSSLCVFHMAWANSVREKDWRSRNRGMHATCREHPA